ADPVRAGTVGGAVRGGAPALHAPARALACGGRIPPSAAMTLGSLEATPLGLARAYLPLANGGLRPNGAVAVRAVRDRDGDVTPNDAAEPVQVVTAAEAYLVTSLLEGVIQSGTGAGARGVAAAEAIAGKTGTTHDGRDAWLVG